MILFELTQTENNSVYKDLEISNAGRQYDFLRSVIKCSIDINRKQISHQVIKALNYHAIACLHTNAGEYRPCEVHVGDYQPPSFFQVPALMDDFVDQINRNWDATDPVYLAAWALWRMNYVHPFINGNGRTARAISYFILCLKLGNLLPGEKIIPQLLKENRSDYVQALREADASLKNGGTFDLSGLTQLFTKLLTVQMQPYIDALTPEPEPA